MRKWWRRLDTTQLGLGQVTGVLAILFIAELLLNTAGHLAEIYVMGRLGAEYVSAITLGIVVLALIFSFFVELGTGLAAMVAQAAGAKDDRAAAEAIGQAILVCAGAALPVSAAGVAVTPLLLRIVGAAGPVLDIGTGYARIGLAAMFILVLPFVLTGALRALGHAALAAGLQVMQLVIFLGLMPVLVLGIGPAPRLGANGSILALVAARLATAAVQVGFLCLSPSSVRLSRASLRPRLPVMRRLLALTWPVAGQQYARYGADVIIVRLIAAYGPAATAAYSIALRLAEGLETIAQGIGNATFTVVGQNLGAGAERRAARGTSIAVMYGLFAIAVGVTFLAWQAPALVRFFSPDPGVLALGVVAVRVLSVSAAFYFVAMVLTRAFHGAGNTLAPMVVDLAALWLVQWPAAAALSQTAGWGVVGIWAAIAIANAIRALILGVWFARRLGRPMGRLALAQATARAEK